MNPITSYLLCALIALTSAGQIYQGTSQQGNAFNHPISNSQNFHQTDQSHAFTSSGRQQSGADRAARILSYQSDKNDQGYQYAYETENGIRAQEVGRRQGKGHAVEGAFSYTGNDGQVYTVTYTADESGFHPQGAHLPTPPPVSEAILNSLDKNARDAANGIVDDGSYKEDPQQYNQQHNVQEQPQFQYSQQHNVQEQPQLQYSQQHNVQEQPQFQYSQQHSVQEQPQLQYNQQHNVQEQPQFQYSQQHNVQEQPQFQYSQQHNVQGQSQLQYSQQHNVQDQYSQAQYSQQFATGGEGNFQPSTAETGHYQTSGFQDSAPSAISRQYEH